MSLYESLEVFVGAGLISIAPVIGCPIPGGAALRGAEFAAFLRNRGEGAPVGELLDRLAHQVWLSQDSHGIQMHVAEDHARKLVRILDLCPPDAKALTEAFQAPPRVQAAGMMTVAALILDRASQQRLFEAAQMSADVAAFLLEQLFINMAANARLLHDISPALRDFLNQLAAAPRPAFEAAQALALVPKGGRAAAVARPTETKGLSDKALTRLSAVAAKQRAWPNPEPWSLESMAQWLRETCEQLTKPSNDAPEVRDAKAAAAAALASGDFERAMELLQQVRRKLRESRRRTQQRLEEELSNLRMQMHQEALATADLGELAMARLDFSVAAELFAEASDGLPDSDQKGRLRLALRQADALCNVGDDRGDAAALREAVRVYTSAGEAAMSLGDIESAAMASLGLGNALLALADHDRSVELLARAIGAFRAALQSFSRERDTRRWALAQVSLGNAIASLCEIGSADPMRLEEATTAYKNALEVLSLEAEPLRWAMVKLNLATVLIRLGQFKDRRANWYAAAGAMVPALEVFEAHGAERYADQARRSLKLLHHQWNLLDAPKAAE